MAKEKIPAFTSTELDVIYQMVKTPKPDDIADVLKRSRNTVYDHIKSIRRKTKTSGTAELLLWIFRNRKELGVDL